MNARITHPPILTANVAYLAALLFLAVAVLPARGQVVTVTTLNDTFDLAGAQTTNDLPGADGLVSFREAIAATNNTPGPQTIEFAIPQSEWWLYTDRAILRLENGVFSVNDDETTIDFTSQTNFTGDTNPDGWEVGIYGLEPNTWGVAAIFINGDNCVVKGLDRVMQRGYGVSVMGNNNRVISCTISGTLYAGVIVQGLFGGAPATGNVVGGTLPGEGNVLSGGNSGLRIDGNAFDNVVVGNTFVGSPFAGIEVRGAYCCPDYTPMNNRIGGPTPEERNWIADNGQYGEEGFPLGDQVHVEWAVGTVIEGNYIGTTQDGMAVFPNSSGTVGVGVRESENTTIRNNLIAGIRKVGVNHAAGQIFGVGISIYGPNTGVVMTGNRVGTDATGANPIPNRSGITLSWFQGYPSDALIGGTGAADGNLIAFNELAGITVASGVEGVAIRGDQIHSNGELGIDLLPSTGVAGPTRNDPGDVDTGANGLQNFPDLFEATANGATTNVSGTLNSTAGTMFDIEFFANDACDPSGNGEGRFPLGTTTVTTDAFGNADFAVDLAAQTTAGQFLTATATNVLTGNTSEFSACLPIGGDAPLAGDINGDGFVDMIDGGIFVQVLLGTDTDATHVSRSDLNGDGAANGLDTQMFAGAMIGG